MLTEAGPTVANDNLGGFPELFVSPSNILSFHADLTWELATNYLVSEWWNRIANLRSNRTLVGSLYSGGTQNQGIGRVASAQATTTNIFNLGGRYVGDQRSGAGETVFSPKAPSTVNIDIDSISQAVEGSPSNSGCLTSLHEYTTQHFASMEKSISVTATKKTAGLQSDGLDPNTHSPGQYIAAKRQEAVEAVMSEFNMRLHKQLSIISCAVEATDGSDSTSRGSNSRESNTSKSSETSGRGRSKRQLSDDGDEKDGVSEGGDGDRDGGDRGGNKRAKREVEAKMFACPFYQHDPTMTCCSRACTGPGWPSIHRLKEHLNRVHRLPKYSCPRCCDHMDDQTKLNEHLRSDMPCEKREVTRLQGINDAQDKKLRERRKTTNTLTEEQKWLDIYMILFPEANQKALPSPYYSRGDIGNSAKSAAQWKKMRKHIEEKLPSAVRTRVEERFAGAQLEVLHDLGDIIRDEIFQIFRGFPQAGSAPGTPGPSSRSATPKATATLAESHEPDLGGLEPFFLNLYNPFDVLSDLPDYDLNQPLGHGGECGSDSGYASVNSFVPPVQTSFQFE